MIKRLNMKISDFFYSIPKILLVDFYRIFIRIRVFNKERLPKNSSAIFAINHTADADPLIILSALKKKIYFISESENFSSSLTNYFMRRFANCIPVFKGQLTKNVKSFKELFYLSNKKNVSFGFFPEGIVNKKAYFRKFHKGAAYFSYKTKLPLIPIYLHNTNRCPDSKRCIWTNRITRGIISIIANTFRKINIFIGEPIDPIAENIIKDFEDLTNGRAYKQITENINRALKEEFLDESGHHGLKKINQEFPIFILACLIFEESYYENIFIEKVKKLKIKHFKTPNIILHSRDIRKWQNDYKCLGDIEKRQNFYTDLDNLIETAEFKIIAAAINKDKLIQLYGPRADNPYDMSLSFVLERSIFYTDNIICNSISIIAESRGKKEDNKLLTQYQLVLSNGTKYITSERFKKKIKSFKFVNKHENSIGTQIADLVAYPIATKIIYPKRINLAFKILEIKIYSQFPGSDYLVYGLKVFP